VYGHHGLRARIADDGAVHDSKGVLVGYINEDGSAGDAYVLSIPSCRLSALYIFLLCFSSGFTCVASSHKMFSGSVARSLFPLL